MQKTTSIIAPFVCSIMALSCVGWAQAKPTSNTSNTTNTETVTTVKAGRKKPPSLPKTGIVKQLTNGDRACYVTLVDSLGKTHNLYGDFDLCVKEKTYLNKQVRLTYRLDKIASAECQGKLPCNKSERVNLVSKMQVIGTATRTNPPTKKSSAAKLPTTGTVKKITNGDLLCYVSLVDDKGKRYELGADFGICGQEKAYLNKKVRLTYGLENVSDCQSAEPCGKTRQQQVIQKIELVR